MIDGQLISISLFSGAFGLDLGLEQAGFHTVSVVEIDADCTKTIALNRPHLKESAVPRDVKQVTAEMLFEEGGRALGIGRSLQPGEVDLVVGGPPCQPFSTAGKRQSVGDPRGSLFMDFVRLVRGIQPRFFIMENVKGLLSAPIRHRPHAQRGIGFPPLEPDEFPRAALNVVLAEMESLGYKVVYDLLEAADYGVPQNRQRVFFIGSRDGLRLGLPLPTHSQKPSKQQQKWRTLRDVIVSLNDPKPEFVPYSENRLKYLRLLSAGQNWRYLPDELKKEAMGGAYNSGGGKVGFYRRLAWDKPSPTVTTSPHQKATDMCHPEELRPLSVRECARVQTFPEDWVFHGSITSKYKQIGNAVPVQLAKAVGNRIYELLQGEQSQVQEESFYQLQLFAFPPIAAALQPSKGQKKVSEQLHELLAYVLEQEVKFPRKKARSLASHFADLQDFLDVDVQNLKDIKGISGRTTLKLSDDEIERISDFRSLGYLLPELTVAENYLAALSRVFSKRQLDMVRSLNLMNLKPNPFLIRALNLDTVEEAVRFNVYAAVTRSIVTSMGFFIQEALSSSSETVEKAPRNSGWDLVKTTDEGKRIWFQIKSGTNAINKDQIDHWTKKIKDKLTEGDEAYLGFTYGKRTDNTVSIGLLKQILPDWELRTLIGRELWDFVSDDPEYSSVLFEVLRRSAQQILHRRSLSEEIEDCVNRIINEFISNYGEGEQGIANYIKSIF